MQSDHPSDTKRCSKCGETKVLTDFHRNKAQRDGRHNWCKPCFLRMTAERSARPEVAARRKALEAARRAASPSRYTTESRRRQTYHLPKDLTGAILESQGGVCGICGTPDPGGRGGWHVDHDHSCCPGTRSCGNCVRGLLCARCNPMLGMAKDNIETLASAIAYLESHGALLQAIRSPV